MKSNAIGRFGEDLAVNFLKKAGYEILQRNYSCKFGEIDVIAYDHGTLCFVEVKTRRGDTQFPPVSSVDKSKQRRLARIAACYLSEKRMEDADSRFDVISIVLHDGGKAHAEVFKGAFLPPDADYV